MKGKLKRANARQLAEFVLYGGEESEAGGSRDGVEGSYDKASRDIYAFVKELLKGDDECEEFLEFAKKYHEWERACLVTGISVGARLAISLELGER